MNHNKHLHIDLAVRHGLFLSICFLLMLPLFCFAIENGNEEPDNKKIVIADSDKASKTLSNSLVALTLAAGTDVDYIGFDLVATKDGRLLVYHDIDLGPTTDVADKFPEHAREDGRFLSVDFTLDEIRLLRRRGNSNFAAPTNLSLGIATLSEYLALTLHLEKQFDKKIGLAPNLIDPGFHLDEGIDISNLCLQRLDQFGYKQTEAALLLQSRDADELQRIKKELLPRLVFDIPLLQRITNQQATVDTDKRPLQRYDQAWMFTRLGARMIASYSSGVVMETSLLHDPSGTPVNTEFVEDIRALALPVYVIINEIPAPLPDFAENLESFYDFYFTKLDFDGIITASYRELLTSIKKKEERARKPELPLFPLKPLP
jgi:glycerophosphoryl diester phosphodiesterase